MRVKVRTSGTGIIELQIAVNDTIQRNELHKVQLVKPDTCFRRTFGLDHWCLFVHVEPPPRDAFTFSAGFAQMLGYRFLSGKYVNLKRNPRLARELC